MRTTTALALVFASGLAAAAQAGGARGDGARRGGVTGVVKSLGTVGSKYVAARRVDVWLPPGYDAGRRRRYPVLYMHDGQNLFDPQTSYIGVDWGVDEAMTRLIAGGKVREAVVVGVWNTPQRVAEYMPQKALAGLDPSRADEMFRPALSEPLADNYLKFLVTELKPLVDARFRTLPGREDTLIMGSSMGGLISLYALSEYPKVFGGAGCVSTHWPAAGGAAVEYFRTRLPDPATHKIYFDYGTETLDAHYEPFQKRVDAMMEAAGYREGKNWVTKKFPGDEHSERAWRRRVHVPLEFLLAR